MKQFLKDLLWLVSEILSLGGRARLDEAKAAYSKSYGEYQAARSRLVAHQSKIEVKIKSIGDFVKGANKALQKAGKLIAGSIQFQEPSLSARSVETLSHVKKFHSGFSGAIGLSVGSMAGGTLAIGSWALVTALGTASTGAAISVLSGIAATNATLV